MRWIAIRHGEDHIHLVAMLARQDGASPACRENGTGSATPAWPPSSGTGCGPPPRPTAPRPAAVPRGDRQSRPPRPQRAPRSRCAATSPPPPRPPASEQEFFARLDQAGMLVRLRYSVNNPGQVTGYAVALPGDTARNGDPSGTAAASSPPTCPGPELRQRWTRPGHPRRRAADRAKSATRCGTTPPAPPPTPRADPVLHRHREPGRRRRCRLAATSDTLHVAAAALGSRILRQAADAYDRAARHPTAASRRPPRPGTSSATPPGSLPPSPTSPATAAHPHRPAHPPRRPRRSRRRTPRIPAARRPGRRRPRRRRTPVRRRPPRPRLRSHARLRAPAPPPSSPGCPSPSQHGPPRSRPHPDSPAPIQAARRQHAGRHHHGHAAPAANPLRQGEAAGRDGVRSFAVEHRTSLTANPGRPHARPMSVSATLTSAPGCSPRRLRPALAARRLPSRTVATRPAHGTQVSAWSATASSPAT